MEIGLAAEYESPHVKSLFLCSVKYEDYVLSAMNSPRVSPNLSQVFTSEITQYELCTVSERTLSTSNSPSGDQRICMISVIHLVGFL